MLKILQNTVTIILVLAVLVIGSYTVHENSRSSKRGEWIRECVLQSHEFSVFGCAQIYDESERQPRTILEEIKLR